MNVENYSEKACVLRGEETKNHTSEITALGGKWNSRLQGGGGWIFPMFKKDSVEKWISYITSAKQIPYTYTPESDDSCTLLKELLLKVNRMEHLLLQFIDTVEESDVVVSPPPPVLASVVENNADEEEPPRFHKRLL